jgi:hypothetical protein
MATCWRTSAVPTVPILRAAGGFMVDVHVASDNPYDTISGTPRCGFDFLVQLGGERRRAAACEAHARHCAVRDRLVQQARVNGRHAR